MPLDESNPSASILARSESEAAVPQPGGLGYFEKFYDPRRLPSAHDWKIEPSQRIYANRNLRLDEIAAIGFDMDYTLAVYLKREIEELAFELSLEVMVRDWGYPADIRQVRYDPNGVIRGLVVDRKLGNLLKMDLFHTVTHALHGTHPLGPEERRGLYAHRKIRLGHDRYFSIDTLFGLPEGALFQQLVDFADRHPQVLPPDYGPLYDALRKAMDRVHRDDSLKSRILQDPERYIYRDPRLPATLEKLVTGGKKLFVATNSEWRYTDAVMSFLLDGQLEYLPHWTDYFHTIVVESSKPRFFLEEIPLERVEEAASRGPLAAGKVYRRGSVQPLEALLGAASDRVLFVGDHIYGDILRSKKACGWRTVMIVEEMERELKSDKVSRHMLEDIERLQRKLEHLDFRRNVLQMKIASMEQAAAKGGAGPDLSDAIPHERAELSELEETIDALQTDRADMEAVLERRYNPTWGPLFRAGGEISRFGHQVQSYACLYTGRVSNFLAYPFNKLFRSPRDLMPHDL
ncbi:MAG: HAD-IG family 5'-nucleotidase [Candidatus Riflebacteria bacterium]|nr:HAD-IG family 5'-nucleotidase [Candidatus Riflebacteria bacterium]